MATAPPDLLRNDAGRLQLPTPKEVEECPIELLGDSSLAESDSDEVEL